MRGCRWVTAEISSDVSSFDFSVYYTFFLFSDITGRNNIGRSVGLKKELEAEKRGDKGDRRGEEPVPCYCHPMWGLEGRPPGARYFLRLPGTQTSVLPALILDLSSVVPFGKSPATRAEPAPHGCRHTSLKQRTLLAEAWNTSATSTGERRWEQTEKAKLEYFPCGDRIRPRRKGNLQVLPQTDCGGDILSRLHCPSVPTTIPGLGWRHFLAAGSCHSQCLRELPGLGTKEFQ